jgi:hypothetical protein
VTAGGKAAVAGETEFAMGAEASCADGPAGKVTRVIIDRDTQAVTHLVIEPRYRLGAACRRKYICHYCTYDYCGCDSRWISPARRQCRFACRGRVS